MSKAKDKGGRPTEYREEFAHMARVAVAESNMSQAKLATMFGVDKGTVTNWKKQHEAFAKALQEGEDAWKVQVVEKNLYRLCRGIRYTETKETSKGSYIYKKFMPPNQKAIEFFLTRRAAERWPNKQQHDISGIDGEPMVFEIKTGIERGPGSSD
jgi:transposase-like protein